jgi:hypothetical protein
VQFVRDDDVYRDVSFSAWAASVGCFWTRACRRHYVIQEIKLTSPVKRVLWWTRYCANKGVTFVATAFSVVRCRLGCSMHMGSGEDRLVSAPATKHRLNNSKRNQCLFRKKLVVLILSYSESNSQDAYIMIMALDIKKNQPISNMLHPGACNGLLTYFKLHNNSYIACLTALCLPDTHLIIWNNFSLFFWSQTHNEHWYVIGQKLFGWLA